MWFLLLIIFLLSTVNALVYPFRNALIRNKPYYSTSTPIELSFKEIELQFDCDEVDINAISDLLLESGAISVSAEYSSEKKTFENVRWSDIESLKSWKQAKLRVAISESFEEANIVDAVKSLYPSQEFNITRIETDASIDWVKIVQENWNPCQIGNLTILFPWHRNIPSFSKYSLIIEGGIAFGTGEHPTTQLCCLWLETLVNTKSLVNPNELSVIDYGCGSGILGMAALKYGANRATGVDIDFDSLLSAKRNACANDLDIDLYKANENSIDNEDFESKIFAPSSSITEEFDIVVSNILAPVLIDLAPQIAKYTKPGGDIGLSGILRQQAPTVIEAYSRFFEDVKIGNSQDDWVLITGKKKMLERD